MSHSIGELEAIALIDRVLRRAQRGKNVELGIGDDAALVAHGGEQLVFTVDASFEHVHFERRLLSLEDIGFRAFAAALSDLAAMGAEPVAALSALALPRGTTESDIANIAKGQAAAARAFGCPLVGGNISRAGEISITTAVLGRAKKPLRRHGARAGDEVWLIGAVGLAAAGLEFLRASRRGPRRVLAAFCRPEPLLREGGRLVGRAHACIDVSDGLAGDARHLAEASRTRIVLEENALRRSLHRDLLAGARALGRDPLELALYGGEDYALLATGPTAKRPRSARRIGRVEKGRGVVLELANGEKTVPAGGFDHLVTYKRRASARP